MGARPDLAERDLHRRQEAHPGLAVGVSMNNLLNIKTPAEAAAQSRKADYNLSNHGISNLRLAYWNLPTEALYEEAIFRNEGATVAGGPFVAHTGKHTARSANDKFVVR